MAQFFIAKVWHPQAAMKACALLSLTALGILDRMSAITRIPMELSNEQQEAKREEAKSV